MARVLVLVCLECREENRPLSGQQHQAQFGINPALLKPQHSIEAKDRTSLVVGGGTLAKLCMLPHPSITASPFHLFLLSLFAFSRNILAY